MRKTNRMDRLLEIGSRAAVLFAPYGIAQLAHFEIAGIDI